MLKAHDVLLVLKLAAIGRSSSYASLGSSIGISASQAYSAAKRAINAGLIDKDLRVRSQAVLAMLGAIKYFIPPTFRGMARGIPTAHGASPLKELIVPDGEPIPVWPDAEGTARGIVLEPIYKTAPSAAKEDAELYELLCLVDALRSGRAREQELAQAELAKRLAVKA